MKETLKTTKRILLSALMLTVGMQLSAQGIIVNKTDGTKVYFKASEVESITTYGYDDETPSYTSCPDGNHPHLISLGLPSGTKWACCNVGADSPEKVGGYYAWGEVKVKNTYTWDSYEYGSGWDQVVPIGFDIASTKYDAAQVNWGEGWHMPTIEQCKELLNECSSEWCLQDGVSGRRFTGSNGGTIFMPAGGYKSSVIPNNADTNGSYWTSTLHPNSASLAYLYEFGKGGIGWDYNSREVGRTIRAVAK